MEDPSVFLRAETAHHQLFGEAPSESFPAVTAPKATTAKLNQ